MDRRLEARVILVTGGSAGIGRATALALARAGASVVIADVDAAGGHRTVDDIARAGGRACFLATDVRDAGEIRHCLDYVTRCYGRLDGAFNSARVVEGAVLADLDMSGWDRVMDVNLRGLWLCMTHEIPLLLQQGGGVIVNHASMVARAGHPRVGAADIASQHGVLGLTRATAREYANQGMRIHAIGPGMTDGAVTRAGPTGESSADVGQVHALHQATGGAMRPEVANTLVGLFSDAAASVTRQAAVAAGGCP
jgi:NAD(P)-dependent dehydrogenase (short-subunit alcohol dehydrogenase family)